jgi:predicted S18 family serine protease
VDGIAAAPKNGKYVSLRVSSHAAIVPTTTQTGTRKGDGFLKMSTTHVTNVKTSVTACAAMALEGQNVQSIAFAIATAAI